MLLDSARRYVSEQYGFDARRRVLASPDARSTTAWRHFAELGFLSLNVPESDGGLGAGAVETLALCIALGEGLVLEPFLSSAVLATRAIATLGSVSQRSLWLPRLAAGESTAVLVHDLSSGLEPDGGVVGRSSPGGVVLSGRVPVVYHAPAADLLLVAASANGRPCDALYAVPAGTAGIQMTAFTTVDGQPAADIEFSEVTVGESARVGSDVGAALAAVVDFGLVALCAETLGALDRCLTLTVEYTRTRNQFGGPIGRFQALQHRMVEMLMRIEQARSLVYLAASRCDDPDAAQRETSVSAATVLVSDAARFVGQQAVQLHGGMGVSDEMPISHYFKRLLAAELRFGSASAHLGRYALGLRTG